MDYGIFYEATCLDYGFHTFEFAEAMVEDWVEAGYPSEGLEVLPTCEYHDESPCDQCPMCEEN